MASPIEPFLEDGILPKKETGAASFLTKYPNYDGRGVVIAILDTGVDPSVDGLQITSDGKPKVIDLVDCTGSGDVDTSTVVKAENGEIKGLTGRTLKIPSSWTVPNGNFHIGVKYSQELYPKALRDRVSKDWTERIWAPKQRAAETGAMRNLEEFDKEHPSCTALDDKLKREELQARVDVLNNIDKKLKYEGSAFDCVVFHDGERWRACMDTTESGDLEKVKAMAPFKDFHEYSTISEIDMMTYSFNIYDNGNKLEVVTNAGSHGTHVACIAAGNFPDNPKVNGVAPGAQVVGLKIGDTRLGSMETGTALVRAMKYVMDNHIDLINYSYGEAAHVCNQGRVINMINEAVFEKGVIFVCSAGNNGPALFTVGTPGGTTTAVIAVGAHVTPQMMQAEYSLREALPPMHYTWSSRGPAHDGALGTCISAPGGAITSVPQWTLRGCQMMNGTSMSSPNACGSLALILSGLKAEKIYYSPFSIRRALENTASHVEGVEVFALGHGIVQVEEAYKYMINYNSCIGHNVQLTVTCTGGKRGVFLREPAQIVKPSEVTVNVEPLFEEETSPTTKIAFQIKFCLTSTQSWVDIPENFLLMNASRTFVIKVDPRGLPEGVHYAEVRGFDSSNVQRGPLFRVPVTVVVPTCVPESPSRSPSSSSSTTLLYPSSSTSSSYTVSSTGISFKPGHIHRRFIHVPFGATYAILKLVSKDVEKSGRYLVHMLQITPQNSYKRHEFSKFFTISDKGESCHAFQVIGDCTMEMCIAKWWASLGELALDIHITFYGVQLSTQTPVMHGGEGVARFDVLSPLKSEDVAPSVSLTTAVCPLRPSDYKLKCLSPERDQLKDGRQIHAIELTYNFNLHKSTDVKADCALLSNHLYESEFESQLWIIYDGNKKYIVAGDAYPTQYVSKLEKNNFTVLLQVRHENREKLEKLKDTILLIHMKLASAISLDVHPSWLEAVNGGKKISTFCAQRGQRHPCFLSQPAEDKFPKGCGPGWFFTGNFSLVKEEPAKSKMTLPFQYFVSEMQAKGGKGGNGSKKRDKESSTASSNSSSNLKDGEGLFSLDSMEEALRDTKIGWLSKPPVSATESLYKELREKYPTHVPTLMAKITALEADKEMSKKEQLTSIYNTAKEAISLVDCDSLLVYYGMKTDGRPDASSIKTDMEQKKGWLTSALLKLGIATADLILEDHYTVLAETRDLAVSELNETQAELLKWFDLADTNKQTFNFVLKHAMANELYGKALKMVMKSWEEKHTKDMEEKMVKLFEKLNWKHCQDYLVNTSCIRFPTAYRPF